MAVALYAARDVFDDEGPAGISCNGSGRLCDRTIDEVAFAVTHNSMSAADQPGWQFTQQEKGIPAQLEAGIRGLMIDMYYGTPTRRGVQNVPLQKVGRRGVGRAAGRDVYLCHTLCGLGATRATDALEDVRDFLAAHPREVIVISIEDHVRPRDVARVFERSGLDRYVWRGARRYPAMREMIESGRPVLAMSENRNDGVPWLRSQFDLVQETPYRFGTPAELLSERSCRPNRGRARNRLFLLNHWVDTSPLPSVRNAAAVNAFDALLGRVRACERIRRRAVNLVAIDFYEQGDVLGVVRELNR